MNIALCHFRVGETDGVSLEMEKWKLVLEEQGNKVIYIGGNPFEDTELVEELHYKDSTNDKIVKNAYGALEDYTEEGLKKEILQMAAKIEKKVTDIIKKEKIDIIVPNNIWSLGWGLPAAIGVYDAVKNTGIKAVVHNHDFYWERDKYSNPTTDYVKELLQKYFPPKAATIENAVINSLAKEELKTRKGVSSTIVPNVFDFKAPIWGVDDYNRDFRKSIGLNENDIIILQATRVTERKAIELAIDTLQYVNSKENMKVLKQGTLYDGRKFTGDIVFVLAGLLECEEKYLNKLKEKAKEKNIKMIFINDVVDSYRYTKDNKKTYSLWDVYVHADFITYPSILEGFGNQFLEGLFAKKPILVYEYPVYTNDLKSIGFNVVSLGKEYKLDNNGLVTVEQNIVKNAAKEVVKYLKDKDYRSEMVEENFIKADEFFSYEALGKILNKIF